MQTAPAAVIDLDAYRSRRRAERAPVAAPAMPVAWVMVWFAPAFVVQPLFVQPFHVAIAH